MITATELRDRIVEIASGFDGVCACAPYRSRMYEAIGIAFDPTPFHVDADGRVHGMSTCYKFGHHVYELGGVAVHNWHIGEPVGAIRSWARREECWQDPVEGCVPDRGDLLLIGTEDKPHVAIVEGIREVEPEDGSGAVITMVDTIDGGQVCRRGELGHDGLGRQMIARRSRVWLGNRVRGDRVDPVIGWVDAGRVRLR